MSYWKEADVQTDRNTAGILSAEKKSVRYHNNTSIFDFDPVEVSKSV